MTEIRRAVAKIAEKYGMGRQDADEFGQTIGESVTGPGLTPREKETIQELLWNKVGRLCAPLRMNGSSMSMKQYFEEVKSLPWSPRTCSRFAQEVINAAGGSVEDLTAMEIKEEIVTVVSYKPGMNQNSIVSHVRARVCSNKNTIRKYLEELVSEREIQKERHGKSLAYVPRHFDNDADLTKSLNQHLDDLLKLVGDMKKEVPKMGFYRRRALGHYLWQHASYFREDIDALENDRKQYYEEPLSHPEIVGMRKDIQRLAVSVQTELREQLLAVARSIETRSRELESLRRKHEERLRKSRGKSSEVIKQLILHVKEEHDTLYSDMYSILDILQSEQKPTSDGAVGRLAETYLKNRSHFDEVKVLLDGLHHSHYRSQLELDVNCIWRRYSQHVAERSRLYFGLDERVPDDRDYLLEKIGELDERIKRLDADLNKVKEWLASEKPLKDLIKYLKRTMETTHRPVHIDLDPSF